MPRLLTDDAGKLHELSIPPPLIARGVVKEMRDAAERLLPAQFRAAMRLIEQPFLQPIYDLESPQMAFGRVALVGDAPSSSARTSAAAWSRRRRMRPRSRRRSMSTRRSQPGCAPTRRERLGVGRRYRARRRGGSAPT